MQPMGRVPSNFGDHGNQGYLVPCNFCSWLSFLAGYFGELTVLPQTWLLNLRERRVGKGMGGDGEGTGKEKEGT